MKYFITHLRILCIFEQNVYSFSKCNIVHLKKDVHQNGSRFALPGGNNVQQIMYISRDILSYGVFASL